MNNTQKSDILNALTEAQKLAFAPMSFQALAAIIDLKILKEIDTKPSGIKELMEELNLSEYTSRTLLEVAEVLGILEQKSEKFYITKLGKCFLYDDMTIANFNFVKDVCYRGAEKLTESFLNNEPMGLKEIYPNSKTIYPYLSKLPDKMKQSWYEFDHYYSDNCFDIIYHILKDNKKIFDIGGNTGKFERVCLKNNPNIDITMIDLEENINFIKEDKELLGCKFHPANILDEKSKLPLISGAVLMSQFLDCFSKEQIILILNRIKKCSENGTKIYILEPFIDKQKFFGAKYSLVHTSLYFTCMANGCSKMYSFDEMEEIINSAGLKINFVYDNLGAHDYTLLECVNNG